ncbi:hypothetical protein [Streptomyces endophytica]|uniref:hypothetical protein n=1 Tax=Streptomyces endophytica TaxID=2991496 RepID=UPI00311B2DC2
MPHRHHHRTRLPRRTLAAAAAAVVAVCGIAACGLLPGETFEDDAVVSKRITAVRLDSDSGGVTVRGGEGGGKNGAAVSLHRSVEYHGDRPQGATHRVEDGVLVLGGCGDECSVTYTLDLPAGIPVSGETSNGAVNLSKVGAVKVTTSSGPSTSTASPARSTCGPATAGSPDAAWPAGTFPPRRPTARST